MQLLPRFRLADFFPRQFFASMGGMPGGMGGMSGFTNIGGGRGGARSRSMFTDDDDDPMSGFSGMPGGMGGGARARHTRSDSPGPGARSGAPSEITRPLKTSLEDLYSGATKHLKVGRKLLSGGTEDKVLEIQVLPGWKSGTKIRFPRAGNEVPGGDAQDLVFVVEEKPHDRFVREGNDLVCHVPIPLVEALTGGGAKRTVEALDGRKLQVAVPSGIVKPGAITTVHGEGMPIRKENKKVSTWTSHGCIK